ncbi:MAG: homocysteine S-methyltransferase family protein [Thermoleophilia bacterium]|nr:homocysteine S-methyltransferase family protein [Thermoleophilia bacterium]
MATYRGALPQLGGRLFLTDGGIETSMIALEGFELPEFAVFPLLGTEEGDAALRRYFRSYVEIARHWGAGLVLETATWRASAGWGEKLGFSPAGLQDVNLRAVKLLEEIREETRQAMTAAEKESTQLVISGCLGPLPVDDAAPAPSDHVPEAGDAAETCDAAEAYHRAQIETFAASAADMVGALTIDDAGEAVGIARAAERAGMPVAISFTVETDGRLATGQPLRAAIEQVEAATSAYPSYYMLNCAHPSHFEGALAEGGAWVERIKGLRANASRLSHAELDALPAPDPGDPQELGCEYARLKRRLPQLNVFGGCCGTDQRHLEHIAAACAPLFADGP